MLFLSESIFESRSRLLGDLDHGRITAEEAHKRMLDLDPADHIAMMGFGQLRRDAGDLPGAEDYFWRAIEAQPCTWPPYLALCHLFSEQPQQAALSQGLAELALSKLLLDDEGLDAVGPEPIPFGMKGIEGYDDLSKHEQIELVVEALRRRRDLEPAAVTARLRPYRLVHQLQEAEDLDAQLVDALVREGASIAPLLVGVLRGWAQDFLPEDDAWVVENTLALLGEIGDAGVIPHLLEFGVLDDQDLSGAAGWAFDRIIELHPEQAARVIGEIASGLGATERMAVVERLLRHPGLDATGELIARLGENLDRIPRRDYHLFFPLLVSAMIAAQGRAGVELARAVLKRNAALLPKKTRRECEDLIEALGPGGTLPPLPAKPSPWTVYDICSGKAIWEEEEDEEDKEEEEDFQPPEPVRRKYTPGRNDPCWCGSGKKYKKCHLDADERPESEAPATRGEFDELRSRLGKFLTEAVPHRESRVAKEEFFGGGPAEEDETHALIDWMMHDWVPPSLGRTVMQEYLRQHGARLTPRERETVESWSRSFVGLYEVREVKVGTGVEVEDFVTGEVFFVHDVKMSKRLVRWDGLLARVVSGERGREFSGVGVTVPRNQLEAMRAWMEEDRRRTGMPWPEYLKANLPRIRRRPAELHTEWIESLRLSNTDGEELLFSKAVYRVVDEETLTAGLRSCHEINEDAEGTRYTWLRGPAEEEGRTVLGSIRVEGAELVFECNSKERLQRGKQMLADLAGPALRHLRDEFTTQREMKRRTLDNPRAAEPGREEIPPEVRHKLMTEVLEKHYAKWPDTALPALDGNTPRQAAKTADGRRKLSALLRNFENNEEHKRQAGEPFYEIARLRAELGLKE
ncbi:MAG: SEC-C domain-containing protein [Bryobacteraceae bacterium]|jgi:hypothetical protein